MITLFDRKRPMSWRRYQFRKQLRRIVAASSLVVACYIPVRLMIATIQAPEPQVILTLGGKASREAFTAEFAHNHPNLKVVISSGLSEQDAMQIFGAAGVNFERVQQDRQATDTVTNFTSLVDQLERQHIHHIYLITSDFHLPRATAIATLVLGSRGIRFTPVSVPSDQQEESPLRVVRDVVRSILWIFTGYTGAELRSRESTYTLNKEVFGSNESLQP